MIFRRLLITLGFALCTAALVPPPVALGAAPTIAGTAATFAASANSTTHAVTLPTGITSGELLFMACAGYANAGALSPTATGWTTIWNGYKSGTGPAAFALVRDADGTEGSTVTVTISASRTIGCWTARLSGAEPYSSTPPDVGAGATASNTSPDPPSLTPTGGSNDYLYFSVIGVSLLTGTLSGNGDTDFVEVQVSAGTASRLGKTHNATTASTSYDPAAFSLTNPLNWVANTIAIYPAAGGGGGSALLLRRRRN